MDLGLSDATVAVTGGTKGMGRAIAECSRPKGPRWPCWPGGVADLDETEAALLAAGAPDAWA